jgi:hypothetical protein
VSPLGGFSLLANQSSSSSSPVRLSLAERKEETTSSAPSSADERIGCYNLGCKLRVPVSLILFLGLAVTMGASVGLLKAQGNSWMEETGTYIANAERDNLNRIVGFKSAAISLFFQLVTLDMSVVGFCFPFLSGSTPFHSPFAFVFSRIRLLASSLGFSTINTSSRDTFLTASISVLTH